METPYSINPYRLIRLLQHFVYIFAVVIGPVNKIDIFIGSQKESDDRYKNENRF